MNDYFPTMLSDIDNDTLSCEACQLAKHKHSFKVSNVRCLCFFECVQSDVWGPCSSPKNGGNKWFVLFVDNYSQFTWLYYIKSKSKIASLIIQFYKMVKTNLRLI